MADYLFDFTTEKGRAGWMPTHDVARLVPDAGGLRIEASGDDPYAMGPPVAVPGGTTLWLRIRLQASNSGMGQVFYFAEGQGPTEKDSVRFPVPGGKWSEIKVPLPALPSPAMRFRIDPPGGTGDTTVIAYLDVTPRVLFAEPEWPAPVLPQAGDGVIQTVVNGDIALKHAKGWGHFAIGVAGQLFALGNNRPLIGYQIISDAPVQWLNASFERQRAFSWNAAGDTVTCQAVDPEGGRWQLEQQVTASTASNVLNVRLTLTVSQDRYLVYFPLLMFFCGMGAFGDKKQQALLAGVEYLDSPDTSSSEADLRGEQAKRQMPLPHMLTLPLMALVQNGRWLALAYEPSPDVAPYFDVPDRRFKSGGHAMALLFPGNTNDSERPAGSVLPYAGRFLKANSPLVVRATLLGGRGDSVTEAVRAYVSSKGLPPFPTKYPPASAAKLFAAGWLKSQVHQGSLYRHAYPGDFAPGPAADAALCQHALTVLPESAALPVGELKAATQVAIGAVPPADRAYSGVGHVRTFAAPLVYGGVWESLERVRQGAHQTLSRFRPDGTIKYVSLPDRPDFGATHFADHANGMTGETIAGVLEAASLTGDRGLRENGLRILAALATTYKNTVPRGAQTWEVPLHTPDILASAHLARAFTLGYELSGDTRFLEAAKYWAWTGIPFVYLSPVAKPVGLYATTPVLGATHWEAPNWIGLPVQWCGLVYANALLDLAAHDPKGIWQRVAEGIVISGLQQTWPVGSNTARQGLLPDSFNLLAQARNDVAINPATLQVPYLRTIGRPLYQRRVAAPGGPFIHAPGQVQMLSKPGKPLMFSVAGWPTAPFQVLVSGLQKPPSRVTMGAGTPQAGKPIPFEYHRAGGLLLLTLHGHVTLTIV